MPNPSILSGSPDEEATRPVPLTRERPAAARPAAAAPAAPPPRRALFNACQSSLVLRAVLALECVLGMGVLFVSSSGLGWLHRWTVLTGAALPATLLWLLILCALQKPLARQQPRTQYMAGMVLGALAGLGTWGLLQLVSQDSAGPWLASVLTASLGAGALMRAMDLRASSSTPAATTARLEELQQRIRPHFLFNTLNSAIALVREDPNNAEAMLEDLSELFRSALADPDQAVTLADEIALAERYLAIEQVRFGPRLRVRWALDPAAGTAYLPKLLLQPLVENAVKHGVEPNPEGGRLRIRTERRGERVVIEVVNSLPPLLWAEQPLPRGHGIALNNVRERLRLLHDMEAHFRAGVDHDHYRVRIDIPASQ